jgi:hypothetical protein
MGRIKLDSHPHNTRNSAQKTAKKCTEALQEHL